MHDFSKKKEKIIKITRLWVEIPKEIMGGGGCGGHLVNFPAFAQGNVRFLAGIGREDQDAHPLKGSPVEN